MADISYIKKKCALFAVMVVVLVNVLLVGCKVKVSTNDITIDGADLDSSQSYFATRQVAKGEGGYYYFDDYGEYIIYYDVSTREATPLCSKAECSHENNNCMAYVDASKNCRQIFYYGKKLYWIENDNNVINLMSCEPDGNARMLVSRLGVVGKEASDVAVFCDEHIYFTRGEDETITDGEMTIGLSRMSLKDKKIEHVFDYKGGASRIMYLKSYGDEVYFVITTVEEKANGTFNKEGKGLYASNVKSGETRQIVDASINDYCIDTKAGALYYYVYNEGLYRENGGKRELVYKAGKESGFCNLSYDGRYVYMDNSVWRIYSDHFMKLDYDMRMTIWIYDDGKLKSTIDMQDEHILSIDNGDSEYFFVDRYTTDKESTVVRKMNGKECFSKKEFFETGKINWLEGDVE